MSELITIGWPFNTKQEIIASGWTGDVVWPSSSTDNAIVRYDWTTWKLIQDSSVTIDDTDNIWNINSLLFNTSPSWVTHIEWQVHRNDTDKTLEVWMAWWTVLLQVWQEVLVRARNETWVLLFRWTPNYLDWEERGFKPLSP